MHAILVGEVEVPVSLGPGHPCRRVGAISYLPIANGHGTAGDASLYSHHCVTLWTPKAGICVRTTSMLAGHDRSLPDRVRSRPNWGEVTVVASAGGGRRCPVRAIGRSTLITMMRRRRNCSQA